MKASETRKAKSQKALRRSSRTIKRFELAQAVQNRSGLPLKEARAIVDQVISIISDTLVSYEHVTLIHFGRFDPVERSARKGRNIISGASVSIPAYRTIVFHSAPHLLQALQSDRNKAEQTGIMQGIDTRLENTTVF